MQIETVCSWCGAKLLRHPCRLQKNAHQFCDRACMGKWASKYASGSNASNWQGGPIKTACDWCGAELLYEKRKFQKATHHFCSTKCKGKWQSEHNIGKNNPLYKYNYKCGPNNPNWKGGVTALHNKLRKIGKGIQWHKKVFRRDNYICQICHHRGGNSLRAHHIKSFADYPENRYDVDNGLTLCESCHIYTHQVTVVNQQ